MNEAYSFPVTKRDVSDVVRDCGQISTAALEDQTLTSNLRVEFQNIQVRLKIWAGNVGASAPGTASLTYRLRDDPDLVEVLLSILIKLRHNLDMAAHPPLLEETEDEGQASQKGRPASVASSSSISLLSLDPDAEESSSIEEFAAPNTPAKCIKEANSSIDRLYRLASVFRKPVSSSENAKILELITKLKDRGQIEELEDVDDHARSHIKAHFPKTPEILVNRLVDSVVFRRMKIRYRQRHRTKLNQGLGLAFIGQSSEKHPVATTSGPMSTIESSLSRERGFHAKVRRHNQRIAPEVAVSATNASSINRAVIPDYARSTALSGITQAAVQRRQKLDVPSPPKHLDAGQTRPECPYCCRFIQLEEFKEPRWTRHILRDIDPYVCLFKGCKQSHALFKTAGEWLGHMQWQHDLVYACQAVGHEQKVFACAEDLGAHLREDHAGTFTESQLPSLVTQGALPASNTLASLNVSYSMAESQCLFCHNYDPQEDDNGTTDNFPEQKLQNHILKHLEDLALLAIPGNDDSDEAYSNVRHSDHGVSTASRKEVDGPPLILFEDTGARAPEDESVPDDNSHYDGWFAIFEDTRHSDYPEPENDPLIIDLRAKQSEKISSRDSESLVDLELRLRRYMLPLEGRGHEKFLPIDMLEKLITRDTVYSELTRAFSNEISAESLHKLVNEICYEANDSGSSSMTRKRIFATLVYINKANYVTHFIDENLYDCDLPFYFSHSHQKGSYVYRKTDDNDEARIHCFSKNNWSFLECESFQNYQWLFLAPYFEIISDGRREQPLHYLFDDDQILPFVEDSGEESFGVSTMFSGGYSEVRRVRIHSAHHSNPSLKSHLFAVKRLKASNLNEKEFKREVATLKRLSSQNHFHLIKLQFTYFYRNSYHLVFRWADGNLREYWEAHPQPSDIPKTREYFTWVATQWLGLAQGLLAIHNCPPDEEIELSDGQANDVFESQRLNGRHGDIKPENILWFQMRNFEGEHSPANGRLVISDFGLREFHRFQTGIVSTRGIAISPTYRAPEYDVSAGLSQSYDIWTLGCVLLEFIVWYLQGYEAFDEFSIDRSTEDNGIIREDKYFAIKHNVKNDSGKNLSAAVLKSSVSRQVDMLRNHKNVTECIVDILDLIEGRMLQMHPGERATCGQVVEMLETITARVLDDEKYSIAPLPGNSRRAVTDLSVQFLSQPLFFDPSILQPTFMENDSQADTSDSDTPNFPGGNAAATQQESTVARRGFKQTVPVGILSGSSKQGDNVDIQPSRAIDVDSTSSQPGAVSNEPEKKKKRRWYQWRLGGGSKKS